MHACCVRKMHIYIFINYAFKRSDQESFVLFVFGSESARNRTKSNRTGFGSFSYRFGTGVTKTESKSNRTEPFRDVVSASSFIDQFVIFDARSNVANVKSIIEFEFSRLNVYSFDILINSQLNLFNHSIKAFARIENAILEFHH